VRVSNKATHTHTHKSSDVTHRRPVPPLLAHGFAAVASHLVWRHRRSVIRTGWAAGSWEEGNGRRKKVARREMANKMNVRRYFLTSYEYIRRAFFVIARASAVRVARSTGIAGWLWLGLSVCLSVVRFVLVNFRDFAERAAVAAAAAFFVRVSRIEDEPGRAVGPRARRPAAADVLDCRPHRDCPTLRSTCL